MKIEESYTKLYAELMKKFPVLNNSNNVKVQLTVNSINQMIYQAHKKGWEDSDVFGMGSFNDLLKKSR